ncbi:hypothetical protein Tco_1156550 [Tanacetum coccineum]|uniref:Uncharacterized protein n=1 Tax=Tanacetum coccineum TaxID=301880 RepID=A0ABQ5E603_9ASTR
MGVSERCSLGGLENLRSLPFPQLLSFSNDDSNLSSPSKNAYSDGVAVPLSSTSGGSLMDRKSPRIADKLDQLQRSSDPLLEQDNESASSHKRMSLSPERPISDDVDFVCRHYGHNLLCILKSCSRLNGDGFFANTKGATVARDLDTDEFEHRSWSSSVLRYLQEASCPFMYLGVMIKAFGPWMGPDEILVDYTTGADGGGKKPGRANFDLRPSEVDNQN